MKTKILLSILFLLTVNTLVLAQNVGINTSGLMPDASAMLDVSATNKGLLIPRIPLTGTTDAVTIPSPATSMLVYNTATAGSAPNNVSPGYYYWNGTSWVGFVTGIKNDQYSLSSTIATTSSTTAFKIFPGLTQTISLNVGDRVLFLMSGTIYSTTSYGYHQISIGITTAPTGGPANGSFIFGLTAGGAAGTGKGGCINANHDYTTYGYNPYCPFAITGTYDVGTAGNYTFDVFLKTQTGSTCTFAGPTSNTTNSNIIYTVIRK